MGKSLHGHSIPNLYDIENDNDTNGRWVIQHNQYTSGSIHGSHKKLQIQVTTNGCLQPNCRIGIHMVKVEVWKIHGS